MKLYSRNQLLISIIGTGGLAVLITLGILWGVGVFSGPKTSEAPEMTNVVFEEKAPVASEVAFSENNAPVPAEVYTSDEMENINIYKNLNEGVVNITSISIVYNWFLEAVPREEGTGSGSIIDQEGHVLTNYHVIENASQLTVTLADGSSYEAEVVGVDPENDLAVVKFDPKGKKLTTIPLGGDEPPMVGQKVLAIGNPFGLERTLTTGIVSAIRSIKSEKGIVIKKAIQTDASINPGNSGGPLLNIRGEMIGINTMIYSPSGGSVGIGFAVPMEVARRVIPDLIRYGKVKRGWIDITPIQLFPTLVRYANLPVESGILVSEAETGGNAEKAGIKGGSSKNAVRYKRSIFYLGGDIIVEVDGQIVKTLMDLYNALEDNKPGDKVTVKALRNKKLLTFEVELTERPQSFQW